MKFKYILDPKSWKLLGIKRGIFKWQIISRYGRENTTIKHYRLLKLFGARLHDRLEIDAYEFRLAYFDIIYLPGLMQRHEILHIPIPFMKRDISIGIHRESCWYK